MKSIVFLGEDKEFINSLKRYIKYLFNINSIRLNKRKSIGEKRFVWADEEYCHDKDWLEVFLHSSTIELVVFGVSEKSCEAYINLLILTQLKSNIHRAINRKNTRISPFLYIKEVRLKLDLLFKGHGESSLFDVLNMTRQGLANGPILLKKNMLDWDEYKDCILNNGIEKWKIFKQRFGKYEIYLRVCGFNIEIEKINKDIKNFQSYVDKLILLEKEHLDKMVEEKIINYNIYIERIDKRLTEIKRRIDFIYDSF